jgi:cell wall-associated NlpC family hydrolase
MAFNFKPIAKPIDIRSKTSRISGITSALEAGQAALGAGVGVSSTLASRAGLQTDAQTGLLSPKPLEVIAPERVSPTSRLAGSFFSSAPTLSSEPTQAPQPTGSTDSLLEAIRTGITAKESGGDYTARSKTSSASGRYQYLRGTWGGYKGYANAADAPPNIQDEKFNQDMGNYLKKYNGNMEAAAIAWFQGPGVADKFAKGDKSVLSKTDANGKTTSSYATEVANIARKYLNKGPQALPVGNSPVGNKVVALATTQFGVKEGAKNANPYSREMANSSGQAWCQDFVNWNLKKSGVDFPPGALTSSTLNSYAAWSKAGKAIDPTQVQPGDLVYKTRKEGGHVAIVVSYDPKTGVVKTISGNSGKGSSEVAHSTSHISKYNIGAVRP